jgi:hypothetical protein
LKELASSALSIHQSAGEMNGSPNPEIRSAAANIPGQSLVDIFVGRLRDRAQEHDGRHDLTRLTESTLRDLFGEPGLLHGMRPGWGQTFNRCHALPFRPRGWRDAGAHGISIEDHGAGAALRDTAPELRAGQPKRLAKHPQQRRRRVGVDDMPCSIYR